MSRRTTPTMPPSRTKSVSQAPRHIPRTLPQGIHTYTPAFSGVSQPNYGLVSGAPAYYSEVSTCLPPQDDTFFPGNDGYYIPASAVAPTDLTFMDTLNTCDTTSAVPTGSTKPPSPPMSEAELLPAEMFSAATQPIMDNYSHYPDPWVYPQGFPPTPPADPMFDIPDMFDADKHDQLAFAQLSEPATECEYLGVSKLQFSSALTRHSQHRLIRSASERSPVSSVSSGSPKDEPLERTKNNPRNDPRYDIKADKDGYYHCPYAAENCNHKPTKQKCIYAKNLDSHLKPYTCKYGAIDENCRSLRFSSNACLFRHEREMHGLHNHGINPYRCKFEGCERARADNGFPRRWNQRDHMKRVHGWEEPDNDDVADRGYTDSTKRRKGPGASVSVPMKRAGSTRVHPYLPGQTRNTSAPRYSAQMNRELQAQNVMVSGMSVDPGHYSQHPMVTQAYGSGIYLQTAY